MIGKQAILDAAVTLAQFQTYTTVTRKQIAERVRCAPGTVSYHFTTMEKLHTAIIKRAVELELPAIIAQGIVAKNWYALHAPSWLREAAAKSLAVA